MRRRIVDREVLADEPELLPQNRLNRKIILLLLVGLIFVLSVIFGNSMNSSRSHVIIVGGGLAGMSATFAAIKNGAFVTLVEKEVLGGNSAKATSGANAVNTSFQRTRKDIHDSIELFIEDTQKAGHGKCNPALVHILAAQSGDAIDSLNTDHGLTLSDIEQLGGHSAKRTHRFPPKDGRIAPVGWTVINKLKQDFMKLVAEKKAELREHTELVDFDLSDKARGKSVTKLYFRDLKDETISEMTDFDAVIFAAGGYAADSSPQSLLAQVRPDLIGFPTTNGAFAKGETLRLGLSKNLKAVDVEQVQLHPTGFVHPDSPQDPRKFLCPEVIRGVGAVLVDPLGKRFIDELKPRDVVSAAILKHGANSRSWQMTGGSVDDKQKIALLLMTDEMADRFGIAAFNFYKAKGFFFNVNEEMVSKAPTVDPQVVENTLREYDEAANGQRDDPFGKSVFPLKFGRDKTLYGAFVTPSLHFTMGGLAITSDARAIDETSGRPILNLYVAGENSGGVHGGNRLGGNGCLESMVFGRLAGRTSSKVSGPTEVLEVNGSKIRLSLENPTELYDSTKKLNLLINGVEYKNVSVRNLEIPGFIDAEADQKFQNVHPGMLYSKL